ncbi:hypothetical protein ABIE20_003952 [Pseudomonas sp. 2835]
MKKTLEGVVEAGEPLIRQIERLRLEAESQA